MFDFRSGMIVAVRPSIITIVLATYAMKEIALGCLAKS
jgi:hypothetical protein